jgi:hypothetical protein
MPELADPAAVEQLDCPTCSVPAASTCRARGGKVAPKYHTPRFMLVPQLRAELEVRTPADRGPGSQWEMGTAVQAAAPAAETKPIRIGCARCSTAQQELRSRLDEALVQDYDGTLRIAPAWPSSWDVSGTVYVQDNTKVDVQVHGGVPTTVAIESGADQVMTVRNPWPGRRVEVVDGRTGRVVTGPTTATDLRLAARSGHSYLVQQQDQPVSVMPFAPVTGTPATEPKHLGSVSIGLGPTASSRGSLFTPPTGATPAGSEPKSFGG